MISPATRSVHHCQLTQQIDPIDEHLFVFSNKSTAMDEPPAKKVRVHFGSLEEQEKKRLAETAAVKTEDIDVKLSKFSAAVRAGIEAGNINIAEDEAIEIATVPDTRKHELEAEFERRKMVKTIIVPTDDAQVKAILREYREPICLFGEGPADRRLRLRALIGEQGEGGIVREEVRAAASQPTTAPEGDTNKVWYHEGPPELLAARYAIAEYSIARAQERLAAAREEARKPGPEKAAKKQELHKHLRLLTNSCSQIGDDRPIAFCNFSPNSKLLATASWSGLCKLWSVPDCELVRVLRGHRERAGAIVFHPQATLSLSPSSLALASCAADGSVCLWNLESDSPMAELEGHYDRVSRLAYHPSGRFLGTACFDHSWRLWDLESKTEILHQEGHSRSVYNMCFHPDGSLAGTCGMDAFPRLWDLRTGKCVMLLEGHLQNVFALDFSPSGYHIATGGGDHIVNIWDIRKGDKIYTIPSHTNLISHVKFQGTYGHYLVTSSYDNTAKIWAHPGWTPLKTLAGHEGKVMCVDTSPDQKYIATSSYDRTFKLWEKEQ